MRKMPLSLGFMLGILLLQGMLSALSADAAIAFRAKSTATQYFSFGTTITVSVPAGVQDGDLLYAAVAMQSATAIPTPAGWTLIRSTKDGANLIRLATFYRIASGDAGASYTWTVDAVTPETAGIAAYTGVDPLTPLDVQGGGSGGSGNCVAPSITTTASNDLLIGSFANTASLTSFTPPGTMTERWDINTFGGASHELADEIFATPGATGTRTATPSSASPWVAHTAAFRPLQTQYTIVVNDSVWNDTHFTTE